MMRKTSKLTRLMSILLSLCMVLGMIQMPVAHAAEAEVHGEKMIYLKPNSNWTQASARFAAYFFGNGEKWVDMKDTDGNGVYEVAVPAGYPSVIFCRMNPGTTANNWNNKWNQSGDLKVPTDNKICFTVPSGAWDGSTTGWAAYSKGFTLTLDMNGNGENKELFVPEGSKILEPVAPAAEGFEFGGWYTEAACTTKYVFGNEVITGAKTLYAKWIELTPDIVSYTVTFNMNGHGTAIEAQSVIEGMIATEPAAPTADGYLFRGWFLDAEGTTPYDFNAAVTADVELFAKWLKIENHTVTLHYEKPDTWGASIYTHIWGGTANDTAWPGTKITDTDSDGWLDVTVTAQTGVTMNFLFHDNTGDAHKTADMTTGEITGDTELWIKNGAVLTEKPVPVFYVAGVAGLCGVEWDCAAEANKMALDEESGLYKKVFTNVAAGTYMFKVTDGTWSNTWGGTATDGNYEIVVPKTGDVTIRFNATTKAITVVLPQLETYTVTFNMNGHGEDITAQTVTEGGKATAPTAPTAEGFDFGGWYTEAECTNAYDFDTVLTGDITLYAKWTGKAVEPDPEPDPEPVTYTVTFDMNGHGEAITAQTVTEGGKAAKPADPTAENYDFGGWYTDAECTAEYDFETVLTGDITLYAKWTEKVVEPEPDEPEARVIYFKPNANWRDAGARFTAYFFGNGELWIPMTDKDNDKVWEVTVPEGFVDVIFVRMDPNNPTNGWGAKWNQTKDLKVPTDGTNCYTLAEGSWDKGNGTWGNYTPPEEPIPVIYVVAGCFNGSSTDGGVFGTAWDPANTANQLVLNEETGLYEKTYTNAPAGTYTFKVTNGSWEQSWGDNGGDYLFTLETAGDFTITFNLDTLQVGVLVGGEEQEPEQPDYYLVGWINNADYTGTAYKFVDGKVTATFAATSYVYVKDSKGTSYYAATYCTDTAVTLKSGNNEKMLAPANVELQYTLVVNGDGTLTLSYTIVVEEPEVPEDWNTVTIHYLKPTTWGSMVNAYLWTDEGKLPNYEAFGAWPGSPISGNSEKAGWYDITIATEEAQAFNFIFNDGSNQTADLTNADFVGVSELWVVGEEIYTVAPVEWTSYTVTVHFQNSNSWSNVYCYAWLGNSAELMGDWPGTAISASANPGWYTARMHVEIGQNLFVIFNDGNNVIKTPDIDLGVPTGNAELWFNGNGDSVTKPAGWIDESRTIHLPGTIGGNNWNAAGNQMTYDAARGLYTITFEDVAPGTYAYKIAVNGAWAENYGAGGEAAGADMSVTVTETQDVTFWYSDVSHRVVCSVNYDIDAVVTLSGTGIPEGTRLLDDELDGLFTATIYLNAGKYSDLAITCGETVVNFLEFVMDAGKNVTFSYDPSTGMAYHNGSNLKVDTTHIYYNTKDINYKDPFGAVAVGESVKFSITTGTDATGVVLVIRGVGSVGLEKDGEAVDGVQRWTCTYAFESIGEYDYYFSITNGSDMVIYCDDIYNNYFRTGDYGSGGIGNPNDIFAYDIIVHTADFETPDWMKDAVIYQIFPDPFFDALEYNNDDQTTARGTVDYEYVTDWYMLPENPEMVNAYPNDYPIFALKGDGEWSNEIYGGDLKGVTERIDYLKALGVNVIYFNPVFSSISNHRYDACDYMEIDPILGTLGDFEELVAVAEANGMHIILDGVFNHVSDDSVYFDRYYKFLGKSEKIGAYPYWAYVYDLMNEEGYSQSAAEAAAKTFFTENYGITDYSYIDWFKVENKKATYADTIGLRAGKKVYTYEGWWGYDSMPVIKSTNGSEYQTGNWAEEMLSHENPNSVNSYWITKGMDGWRLDVANEVSDETWRNFRDSVKALDSEAVIIGEIWHDATYYLRGDMYDSVMNYIFRDAVAGFARGYLINRDNKAEKWDTDYTAADALVTLEILRERYPEEAFYAMMNLVGSHDTARILSYLDDVEDDRYQKDLANNFPMYETTSERAKQLQYVVAFIQFTYAGAPTIYYGDEIGMTGCDDPDDRRAFEWGKGQKDLVEWYAQLAAIRAQYPALRTGSVEPFAPHRDVMGYVRTDGENTLTILANRASGDLNVALEGTYVDLISGETFTDTVTVPAYRGVILVAADEVKDYEVDTEALAPAYDPAYIVEVRGETPPADPQPEPETYTVTFNMNGHGTAIAAQTIIKGEKATEPAAPTAEGYTFGGWYTDAACTAEYDFDTAVIADITLYAKWTENVVEPEPETYTVTFNMNGHGAAIEAQTVTEGEKATEPAAPTAEGYTFSGWYTDAAYTAEYDFDTAVTADITLYAKWTENVVEPEPETYAVTFNMNGHGAAIEAQTVTEGEKATEPAAPTAEGYTFGGWYTDAACTAEYDFDTAVTADITLYAKWTENVVEPEPKPEPEVYLVSYNLNGHGAPMASQRVVEGEKAVRPADPTAEGYTFDGWYLDAACTIPFNFNAELTESVMLYAKWIKVETEQDVDSAEVFEDLTEEAWYFDAVDFMVDKGLMNGVSENEFAPEEKLSRAMMWTILARLSGEDTTGGVNWYDKGREWAMNTGISDGSDADAEITREQLVVMLWRFMGEPAATGSLSAYTDADSVSDWAKDAMAWAIETGLVNGTTPTTLDPKSNATRAQVATLVQRFYEMMEAKN